MPAFIFILLIIWGAMWLFFKFMYPKPPKAFFPQQGDIVTPRDCDFCGFPLAQYRGIVETKPNSVTDDRAVKKGCNENEEVSIADINNTDVKIDSVANAEDSQTVKQAKKLTRKQRKQHKQKLKESQRQAFAHRQQHMVATTWFFCNHDHQTRFHAGEIYAQKR